MEKLNKNERIIKKKKEIIIKRETRNGCMMVDGYRCGAAV